MKRRVSCIIPNFNGGAKLIKSIKLCISYCDEVIVIDDCSKDDSKVLLKKIKSKKLIILKNGSNKGSSYSRNRGARKAKFGNLLFIDSDCYLTKVNFEKLVLGRREIIYPRIIDSTRKDYNSYNGQTYIDNSVCFFLKKKDFFDVGGFDEKIKIYMDDVEFFFKCYKEGLTSRYVDRSIGRHDAGQKTPESISKGFFLNLKHTVYFCLKHKRGLKKEIFPTWFTVFANLRRSLLNKDRFYDTPLTGSKPKTFCKSLVSIIEGFRLYFSPEA
tara:strand:- start:528 stop:1340 length:813 start_codon:yes stop_codon:yes gene_type:complete